MAITTRRPSSAPAVADRWDPFRELEMLHSRTRQLVESAWPALDMGDGASWIPSVDIEETEDAWIVEAELPGVDPKDVDIQIHGNELSITGEIKERERKGIIRRRARRVGRFEFRVELSGEADAENADASIDNGVLTLRIPKSESSQPRRIEVSSNGAEARQSGTTEPAAARS